MTKFINSSFIEWLWETTAKSEDNDLRLLIIPSLTRQTHLQCKHCKYVASYYEETYCKKCGNNWA